MVHNELKQIFDQAGYKFRTFHIDHLKDAGIEFKQLQQSGLVDSKLYNRYLAGFNLSADMPLNHASTVIIVAMPHYPSKVGFTLNDRVVYTVLPPQYAYPEIEKNLVGMVKGILDKYGVGVAVPKLPFKYLSAMSGLCKIGRNNLSYAEGFGSYLRLSAFVTSMEVQEDQWTGLQRMEACEKCKRCLQNCPTSAIDETRYLIHAERCMTYFNEEPGDIPEWIEPEWHNAIVGCMRCQAVCPQNAPYKDRLDMEVVFDAAETKAILEKTTCEALEESTRSKLDALGLLEYLEVLGRNLKLLVMEE